MGLTEWEITGIALSEVSLKSVEQPEAIRKEQGEALTADELPGFVQAILTHPVAGELQVQVPVIWDVTGYDPDKGGTQKLEGTLSLPGTVAASDKTVTIDIVTPHTHAYTAVVTAPTCTEGGFTTYTCECGHSYVADETEALGHDFVNGKCSRCDAQMDAAFVDVPVGSFFFDPVQWAVDNKITAGTTPSTFDPNGQCMRAVVVTFLWRAAGSPDPSSNNNPFTDVKEGDYFYKAVLWAVENKITAGLTATTFGPTNLCNRAQVGTFLYRAYNK